MFRDLTFLKFFFLRKERDHHVTPKEFSGLLENLLLFSLLFLLFDTPYSPLIHPQYAASSPLLPLFTQQTYCLLKAIKLNERSIDDITTIVQYDARAGLA